MRYAKRVARGASLLDEVNPEWYNKIDTDTLNVSTNDYCVLGQLYGEYNYGLMMLSVLFSGSRRGFISKTGTECLTIALVVLGLSRLAKKLNRSVYRKITNLWLQEIIIRREAYAEKIYVELQMMAARFEDERARSLVRV